MPFIPCVPLLLSLVGLLIWGEITSTTSVFFAFRIIIAWTVDGDGWTLLGKQFICLTLSSIAYVWTRSLKLTCLYLVLPRLFKVFLLNFADVEWLFMHLRCIVRGRGICDRNRLRLDFALALLVTLTLVFTLGNSQLLIKHFKLLFDARHCIGRATP